MTFKNWLYNKIHRVKRGRAKGARNVGIRLIRGDRVIVKFDWSKPFEYVSKMESYFYGDSIGLKEERARMRVNNFLLHRLINAKRITQITPNRKCVIGKLK